MKVLSAGLNTFHETGKYTCATVEYAGLLSYSLVKNGGICVAGGVRKITAPVAMAICWPYDFIKDKTSSVFKRGPTENLKGLIERLAQIEERLAQIEKFGALPDSGKAAVMRKKKELNEGKRMVLKGILEETKSLRETK